MKQVAIWVRRAENAISLTALAILVLSVLWGVLTRYVTSRPAVWTTELSGILFTWVVFIGAMTAYREGRHIRVTLLVDILPTALQILLIKASDFLVAAFLIYVTYLSVIMMQNGASRPSPVLDIPFSWVYLATVISFAGMSVTSLLRLTGVMPQPEPDQAEDIL